MGRVVVLGGVLVTIGDVSRASIVAMVNHTCLHRYMAIVA